MIAFIFGHNHCNKILVLFIKDKNIIVIYEIKKRNHFYRLIIINEKKNYNTKV